MKVQVYLNFDGNAEEAFEFYKSVFGRELAGAVRFKDMPMEGFTIPAEDENKMMHIALPITDDSILMATDVVPSMGQELKVGNNVYVSLHPESREEADRLFNGLSAGGDVEMPMGEQVWGDYYGSFTDRFGVKWMINHSTQQR